MISTEQRFVYRQLCFLASPFLDRSSGTPANYKSHNKNVIVSYGEGICPTKRKAIRR